MDICLSSGTRQLYAQDVLRALSMPTGSRLQFRYRKSWLSESTLRAASQPFFRARPAVIAYIDQHTVQLGPELIPVRYATIVGVQEHGSTVSLILELGPLAKLTNDLLAFNDSVKATDGGSTPQWVQDATAPGGYRTSGKYWYEFDPRGSIDRASDAMSQFEHLADALSQRADFANQHLFYHVVGIRDIRHRVALVPENGVFRLDPNRSYALQFYHFFPRKDVKDEEVTAVKLTVTTGSPYVTIRSSGQVGFASLYDLHQIEFTTTSPPSSLGYLFSAEELRADLDPQSVMTFSGVRIKGEKSEVSHEFDVPISVRFDSYSAVVTGMLVGVLIAIPSLISAVTSGKGSWGAAIAIVVTGIFAGIIAVFGVRKPL